VKVPLETSDGTEYAWIAVEKCHAGRFEGELLNDPHGASKLRAGAKIEVPLADAYDYDYTRADGTTEGNETTKILQARQR